jgi:hypothetical protein
MPTNRVQFKADRASGRNNPEDSVYADAVAFTVQDWAEGRIAPDGIMSRVNFYTQNLAFELSPADAA